MVRNSSSENAAKTVSRAFGEVAASVAKATGQPAAFAIAAATVIVWSATGPVFHFSDTWQLVINTATTIVTFLMVFLIQNTQNRDAKTTQLKLDELIRGVQGARTGMVRLEELSDEELKALASDFERLRARLAASGQGPGGLGAEIPGGDK